MYFNTAEQTILAVLIISALSSFSYEIFIRYRIIMKGTGSFSFDKIHIRLKKVLLEFLFQQKVISQRFWPGLMHSLVFWGFLFFGIITIDHFFIGFNLSII